MCNHTNPDIWSTNDILSKLNISSDHNVFASSGIQAFSIGECNSHTMSIHAFWWTNHSCNLRKRSSNCNGNNKSSYPVYGIGILYYVDTTTGKLKGILTWGINPELLQKDHILSKLKVMLQTNGRNIHNNEYPLTIQDLSHESQNIIQNILKLSSKREFSNHVMHPGTKEIVKPFYRYTPSKNSVRRYITSNNLGLKRLVANDPSNNNNNYSLISHDNNNIPFLLPRSIQSIEGINTPLNTQQQEELKVILSSYNEVKSHDYARPSKEDSIWMYQGEEDRFVSAQQKQMNMFLNNIKQGRFSDGSDPLSS